MKTMKTYPIYEMFTSIEGEGSDAGIPTAFIRMSGCNLKCPWCDTKESWKETRTATGDVRKFVENIPAGMRFSITGGDILQYPYAFYVLAHEISFRGCEKFKLNLELAGVPGTAEAMLYLARVARELAAKSKIELSANVDVKLPLYLDTQDKVEDHVEFAETLVDWGYKVDLKFLVRAVDDVIALKNSAFLLKKLVIMREVPLWVAPVRDEKNRVDKRTVEALVKFMLTSDLPLRVNPNIHVQLGLR